ncbi:hypothetical protein IKG20_01670 [Candidatus Saccharibacteria bacterium]|nr:hypothetical protein [Candidatus Saccharibacteria bacterium]
MKEEHPADEKTTKKSLKEQNYQEKQTVREHSSAHVVAFVLGLVSLLGHLFWYISLPTGVLAIIFGAISTKKTASKLGKAGLILGIVGLSLTVFIYVTFILITLLSWY